MAALNCVWVCALLGGTTTWNNDASLARVTAAWDYAKSNLGVKTDKLVLWGGSMGGGTALTYALTNPANVAAVGVSIPALDPEYVRTNNVGGYQASIEANYGAATPVPTVKQPVTRGSEWPATSIPLAVWYSTSDPYTPQASTETFGAAAGAQMHSLGAVGHSYEAQLYGMPEPAAFLGAAV